MTNKLKLLTRTNSFKGLSLLALIFMANSCKKDEYDDVKPPVEFSSEIPVDVDPALQEKLKKEGDIYQLNEAFNEHSWKSLVAIFWPMDKDGKPKEKFNDEGKSTWLTWKEAFQVYRADGGIPAPWGSKRTGGGLGLPEAIFNEEDTRLVLSSFTPTHINRSKNIADETDQAFAGELFDQNGNVVVYEVLMNRPEFDYVVSNRLYNINGQIEFTKKDSLANFPAGDYQKKKDGAIEIKFAWKILEKGDDKDRYYKSRGYIINPKTKKLERKDLGMIGFHISQKTPTGKQWVWSTFEQIDNLDQNVIMKDGKKTIIHPSLTNPECETCPVNVDVTNGGTTYAFNTNVHSNFWTISGDKTNRYFAENNVMKTQAKRMIDIPVRVQEINKRMQAYFRSQKSVWQYYQLIDTQYPLDQNAAPGSHQESTYHLPQSVANKPGGNPNLTFLTNISMETFFQGGNQSASNFMEANPKSDITVFGTESCMGCHSSAGIYNGISSNGTFTQGDQLTGDFSWLLTQKAQWNKKVPIPIITKPQAKK